MDEFFHAVLHRAKIGWYKACRCTGEESPNMKPDPKIFEDLTRMAGGAMNVFSGVREQVLSEARTRFDEMASRLDLVPREDFDRLEAQVKALQKRLDAVEGKKPAAPKTKAAAPKAAAKKTVKKTGKKK